jgi:hypothetical protein
MLTFSAGCMGGQDSETRGASEDCGVCCAAMRLREPGALPCWSCKSCARCTIGSKIWIKLKKSGISNEEKGSLALVLASNLFCLLFGGLMGHRPDLGSLPSL